MSQTDEVMRLLNVRVTQDLRDLIEEASVVSAAHSMSEWVREALLAGATRELEVHRRSQSRTPTEGSQAPPAPSPRAVRGVIRRVNGLVVTKRCTHPPTARWIGVTKETCTLCGAVTKWRI